MTRPLRVGVHLIKDNHNSVKTCGAFAEGIKASGDAVVVRTDRDCNVQSFDAVVLWGYITSCQNIIKACQGLVNIPWVFIDLGYWRREHGYFKVSVNDRHPTAYLMKKLQPNDRWAKLNLSIKPWRTGTNGHVLVAGMSHKAAWSWGLPNESYEKLLVQRLLKVTKRQIIYRPKPNWSGAQPIVGSTFDKSTPLAVALHKAHCVVTHHSNVACDALLAGVPVFSKYGVASVMGIGDLQLIETPSYPEGREQWARNVAYSQWTIEEMRSGVCWQHLKKDGLVV